MNVDTTPPCELVYSLKPYVEGLRTSLFPAPGPGHYGFSAAGLLVRVRVTGRAQTETPRSASGPVRCICSHYNTAHSLLSAPRSAPIRQERGQHEGKPTHTPRYTHMSIRTKLCE